MYYSFQFTSIDHSLASHLLRHLAIRVGTEEKKWRTSLFLLLLEQGDDGREKKTLAMLVELAWFSQLLYFYSSYIVPCKHLFYFSRFEKYLPNGTRCLVSATKRSKKTECSTVMKSHIENKCTIWYMKIPHSRFLFQH